MTVYILLGIYFVLFLIWLILLLSNGAQAKAMTDPLDSKKFTLKSLYSVGFSLLNLVHYSYNTSLDAKRLAQCKIVYGEKYGEYYFRIHTAEKVTFVFTALVVTPLFGAAFNDPIYCVFGLFLAGIMYYASDSKITDIIKAREVQITKDFCDMVSKMALLINAGMITREAWEQIAFTGTGTLYEEMQTTILQMQNGVGEIDAYIGFGNRCGVQLISKFISMLVQNISKGNKELVDFLKEENAVCWEEKKNIVKRQGEAASSKLMIPMGLILVGIFVMILVPIVSNIGM